MGSSSDLRRLRVRFVALVAFAVLAGSTQLALPKSAFAASSSNPNAATCSRLGSSYSQRFPAYNAAISGRTSHLLYIPASGVGTKGVSVKLNGFVTTCGYHAYVGWNIAYDTSSFRSSNTCLVGTVTFKTTSGRVFKHPRRFGACGEQKWPGQLVTYYPKVTSQREGVVDLANSRERISHIKVTFSGAHKGSGGWAYSNPRHVTCRVGDYNGGTASYGQCKAGNGSNTSFTV